MRKAVSPIVSAILLITVSISIISIVAPWMYELVTTTTNTTSSTTQQQIKCRNAGLDFDSNYGYFGVDWNFTGNGTDFLNAKLVNTGNVNLWGFSFEVTLESQSGEEIKHYNFTDPTKIESADPLRPSMSAIAGADITEDINGTVYTLKAIKLLNSVCVEIAPALTV